MSIDWKFQCKTKNEFLVFLSMEVVNLVGSDFWVCFSFVKLIAIQPTVNGVVEGQIETKKKLWHSKNLFRAISWEGSPILVIPHSIHLSIQGNKYFYFISILDLCWMALFKKKFMSQDCENSFCFCNYSYKEKYLKLKLCTYESRGLNKTCSLTIVTG